MKEKNYVLLLTACIKPPDLNLIKHSIHRSDPLIRLDDYKNSLKYWLLYKEPLIKGIIFVENSGFELAELKEIVIKNNNYNRKVEFLQYEASEIPEGLHYGYSELEMIDYAFEVSELIRNSNFIIKVTGRLYFPKLSMLINKTSNDCVFIADSRNFKFLTKSKRYILTPLFIVKKDFYRNRLFNVKERMVEMQDGLIETLYFNILMPLYLKKAEEIMLRFPINVEPVGVGAHWNINYSSFKKKLPSYFRGVCRRFLPNFWI